MPSGMQVTEQLDMTKCMNTSNKQRLLYITQSGIIAAVYVVLTVFAKTVNLADGAIQCRFSEALTVLPFFTKAAIPGVSLGCLLANLLIGGNPIDIVFGTLATLLGCLGTYKLRRHKFLCTLPPVIANTLIVPFILRYAYGIEASIPFLMLTVCIGEIIMCVGVGSLLISALVPARWTVFKDNHEYKKI